MHRLCHVNESRINSDFGAFVHFYLVSFGREFYSINHRIVYVRCERIGRVFILSSSFFSYSRAKRLIHSQSRFAKFRTNCSLHVFRWSNNAKEKSTKVTEWNSKIIPPTATHNWFEWILCGCILVVAIVQKKNTEENKGNPRNKRSKLRTKSTCMKFNFSFFSLSSK